MIAGCTSSQSTPSRDFTTAELIIDKDTLPADIQLYQPEKVRPDDFGGHEGGVSATAVDYNGAAGGFHVVIQFHSDREAVQAYQEHAFTTDDTRGKYGTTWKPLLNFAYHSTLADRFQVVCGTTRNISNIGAHCFIEAQYAEFVSLVNYSTLDAERALSDLETLAKAVDARFTLYLQEDASK
jgi:hypothetical protein